MRTLAFNKDNKILAGGSGAGQTWMWNITDRQRPQTLAILSAAEETTWSLAFSPDGQTLAGVNGDLKLWDTNPDRIATQICSIAGDMITETEWGKHVPGVAYHRPCP
jgi:WD40 repeat protein